MSEDFAGGELEGLFQEMQRLQGQLAAAEDVSRQAVVEGRAGGGVVKVRVSGEFEFSAVEINPSLLESGDAALLEDLLLAAIRDAASQLIAVRKAAVQNAVGGAIAALLDNPGGEDADEDEDDAPSDEPGD